MTAFIFKSTLILFILYGLYWFLLRKEKLFKFNRYFLILSIVFSLIVPFISISINVQESQNLGKIVTTLGDNIAYMNPVQDVIVRDINSVEPINEVRSTWIDASTVLMVVYFSGVMLFLLRFLKNIYSIFRLIKLSERLIFRGHNLVLTENRENPYCFFNYVFLNKGDFNNLKIDDQLLSHEHEHIKQYHSVDIVFIELIKIFYWFNPVYLLYDRAIRINHEYLADHFVIQDDDDIKSYSEKLLDFIFTRSNLPLTSGSNQSFIKKRLLMMTKSTSRSIENIRMITTISMVFVFFLFLSLKQSDRHSSKMTFIPYKVYDTIRFIESDTSYNITTYSEGFYVSNEVTNKEYREFTDWVNNNPDESIYQRKDISKKSIDPKTGKSREIIFHVPDRISLSEIKANLIDSTALYQLNKEYKNYFTDKRYDNYPVVGVSRKMAEYYCLWKTQSEVIITIDSSENGTGTMMSSNSTYRLPTEKEWEYSAQMPFGKKEANKYNNEIQEVTEGDTNQSGLSHLDDNVSEWVTSEVENSGVARGGSWKTAKGISARQVHDQDYRDGIIGFRIVQVHNPKRTDDEFNRSGADIELTQNGVIEIPSKVKMKESIDKNSATLIMPAGKAENLNGKQDAVIAITSKNVLYRGIPNPLEFAITGIVSDKVSATITNGTLKRATYGWDVFPGDESESEVTININGKKRFEKKFIVKDIPDPVAIFYRKSNGSVTRDMASKVEFLEAELRDSDLDIKFKIVSFTLAFSKDGFDREIYSNGNMLTDEMKSVVSDLTRGQSIILKDIKAIGPDSKIRDLNPIMLKID